MVWRPPASRLHGEVPRAAVRDTRGQAGHSRRTHRLLAPALILLTFALALPIGAAARIATGDGGGAWRRQSVGSISRLKPASGKRGASSVHVGGKTCTNFVSWSYAQVPCAVPAKAKYGAASVTVTTAAGKSNARIFTVKR